MPHSLITGMSMQGKTSCGKKIAQDFKNKGIPVMVLDPMNDAAWPCDYKTSDPVDFMDKVKKNTGCALFVDESGRMIGRYNSEMEWLATESRHLGYVTHFMLQRPAQISPTIREQCFNLYLFQCGFKTSKDLAEEWIQPGLGLAPMLPRGYCYHVNRNRLFEKVRVF